MDNTTEIGFISANIAGDYRYTDTLKVTYNHDTKCVRVRVFVTGAVGGMDGGRSDSYEPRADWDETVGPEPTAKDVLALVKRALGNNSYNFKRYGKPTKRFTWVGAAGRGLNAKLVAEAMKAAIDVGE